MDFNKFIKENNSCNLLKISITHYFVVNFILTINKYNKEELYKKFNINKKIEFLGKNFITTILETYNIFYKPQLDSINKNTLNNLELNNKIIYKIVRNTIIYAKLSDTALQEVYDYITRNKIISKYSNNIKFQ